MKKLIWAGSFALGLMISAQTAQADNDSLARELQLVVSGQVESWYGVSLYGSETGVVSFTDDTSQIMSGLSARVSLPLATHLSVQMDGDFEYSSTMLTDGQQDDLLQKSFLLGGHLSFRNPSTGLIGGFAAFGSGNTGQDPRDSLVSPVSAADVRAVGGEFQVYLHDVTFYGQAGYLDSKGDDNFLRDALFGRGVVRWFITPDTRLQVEASYVDGRTDLTTDDDEMTIIEWGARFDTALPSLPIVGETNIFIGYRGAEFEKDDPTNAQEDSSFVDHTIMAGFAMRFGATSAQEQDRAGATLDFPNFGRWVAAGQPLDQ